jgi:predicted PurR-regulated permease PerM
LDQPSDPLTLSEPASSAPTDTPHLSRNWIVTASLVVIAVCIAGTALMYARAILTPLLIAIFLYFLIQPVIEFLFRLKLPPIILYPFIIALPIGLMLIGVLIIDANVRAFGDRMEGYKERLFTTLDGLEETLTRYYHSIADGVSSPENDREKTAEEKSKETSAEKVSKGTEQPHDGASEQETKKTRSNTDEKHSEYDWHRLAGEYIDNSREAIIASVVGMTMNIVEVTVLVVFYLLFLFLEARKLRGRVQGGFEPETAARVLEVINKIDDSIRSYLWIKTALSFGLGVTTTILCWLFGLDFALLWGVFMFLANYVTYVGSIVALAPPIGIAFVQFSPVTALFLTALLILNRLIWIDYAEIRFSGEQLNVSPLLLLLSIALLGWIWGVVGMLLAVPLVTSTKIVLSHFDNTRYLAKLMSDD